MPATRRLILIIIILLLLILFLVVPSVSWSQSPQTPASPWQDSAREFAKKVVALTGPRQTVALSVRNISSLSDSEVAAVRLALEAELRAAGLRFAAKPDTAPELRVTLSENMQGLLWIAEIPRGDSREVAIAMLSLPKVATAAPTGTTQMFVVQSKLIWEQDDPILDFALLDRGIPGAGQRLLLLEPARVSLYQADQERFKFQQSVALPTNEKPARDPRGYLVLRDDYFLLTVAGNLCRGVVDQVLNVTCWNQGRDVPRPFSEELHWIELSIVPGRNFFRQRFKVQGSDEQREALFSSAAGWVEAGEPLRFDASLDGVARLYRLNANRAPAALFSGWGSQLTGISSDCGRRRQLLVTRQGDWTALDAVQAFDVIGDQAIAVSSPLEFPGPVKELWPGTTFMSALAIVQNLKTSRYEAYILTLSCGR
ncbi:MAG: hypothetical protein M1453_14525 [Acidobacteria bacterium]|nr:hypothetical protein [Acidobacteriota bacterium]